VLSTCMKNIFIYRNISFRGIGLVKTSPLSGCGYITNNDEVEGNIAFVRSIFDNFEQNKQTIKMFPVTRLNVENVHLFPRP